MTKAELARLVQDGSDYTLKESVELVDTVLELMKQSLESGESIKIWGFGSFEVNSKHDRRGRNPVTGEAITIASRRVMTFRPSAVLRDQMNND